MTEVKGFTNSLGTETKTFVNDIADRTEVTFIPENFYCILTERMLWKALERDMSRQLRNAYDKMFGEDMKLIDKLHQIASHKRYAIDELKRWYYKHNSFYKITIIINGFAK